MTKKQHANWEQIRLDAANWLVIPELGVSPADVNFEGFENPIVRQFDREDQIYIGPQALLRSVRTAAIQRFGSLAAIREAQQVAGQALHDQTQCSARDFSALVFHWFNRTLATAITDHRKESPDAFRSLSYALRWGVSFLDAKDPKADLVELRRELARLGADSRHRETRAIKSEVWAWLNTHRQSFKSKNAAAEGIVKLRIAPLGFRTAYKYVKEWDDSHSAGRA